MTDSEVSNQKERGGIGGSESVVSYEVGERRIRGSETRGRRGQQSRWQRGQESSEKIGENVKHSKGHRLNCCRFSSCKTQSNPVSSHYE